MCVWESFILRSFLSFYARCFFFLYFCLVLFLKYLMPTSAIRCGVELLFSVMFVIVHNLSVHCCKYTHNCIWVERHIKCDSHCRANIVMHFVARLSPLLHARAVIKERRNKKNKIKTRYAIRLNCSPKFRLFYIFFSVAARFPLPLDEAWWDDKFKTE